MTFCIFCVSVYHEQLDEATYTHARYIIYKKVNATFYFTIAKSYHTSVTFLTWARIATTKEKL